MNGDELNKEKYKEFQKLEEEYEKLKQENSKAKVEIDYLNNLNVKEKP